MTGNVDRMLSTSHSSADKKAGPPVSASVRQEEADLNDGREPEEEEQPQDDAEWQEYEGGAEQRDCTDGLAEAVWDKRIPQTSTQYPICSRTPRVSRSSLLLDVATLQPHIRTRVTCSLQE
ncbi:uncharacterized protein EMH_0000620 [Eimeria mitis]|uniref:Uncharacterized protein n=1 Tax=Eimeria mitis TaxID=44415 RepID=U6KGF2_9EIME|nr:uncharacterized protein EMH_0000620 [Eimeria mitis]CDJ35836.1 hypothetical protein EMH_0000620 [Eimeria mitis]